jgi:two-component system sensor histidine kinase KdpD
MTGNIPMSAVAALRRCLLLEFTQMGKRQNKLKISSYLISIGLVILVTLFGELLRVSFRQTNLAMLYFLIVIIAALRWGPGPAVMTGVLGALSFDYFLVPPYFAFAIVDVEYIFTFAIFLIVALTISALASKTKKQAIEVREKEIQADFLRQNEKFQAALLNSVSHDLKTPLVSITGALNVLSADPDLQEKGDRRELLENACEQANHLNRIVGNLLNMSRMESGKLKLNAEMCELTDILESSIYQLRDKIGDRDITVHIPTYFPEIYADPLLMSGVFGNLIDNALKFSPKGSPVEIQAGFSDGKTFIEVKDRGLGIEMSDLDRIFEKFYRSEATQRMTGTGLGLCICKGIVEAHNGSIAAFNNPDKGATLRITLPFMEQVAS